MTNSRAKQIGTEMLVQAFKLAKLKKAKGMTEEEVKAAKVVLFWHNTVTVAAGKEKQQYVTFDIMSPEADIRADDIIVARAYMAQIDIWSKKGFDSPIIAELVEKLEEQLTIAGFEVTLADEMCELVPNVIYHQPMLVEKLIF